MIRRIPTKARYHRIDGWRGYEIPALAVAGASDTGMASDSPAPSDGVSLELANFIHYLRKQGIIAKEARTQSSNVFMQKRWVVVSKDDFDRAAKITVEYMAEHRDDTQYIHEADLDEIGYKASAGVE